MDIFFEEMDYNLILCHKCLKPEIGCVNGGILHGIAGATCSLIF